MRCRRSAGRDRHVPINQPDASKKRDCIGESVRARSAASCSAARRLEGCRLHRVAAAMQLREGHSALFYRAVVEDYPQDARVHGRGGDADRSAARVNSRGAGIARGRPNPDRNVSRHGDRHRDVRELYVPEQSSLQLEIPRATRTQTAMVLIRDSMRQKARQRSCQGGEQNYARAPRSQDLNVVDVDGAGARGAGPRKEGVAEKAEAYPGDRVVHTIRESRVEKYGDGVPSSRELLA